jgi:MFS transporter, FHS family, L-fucose permease
MKRSRYMVGIVLLTFFVMSLVTNILGPIVPDIILSFHLSLTAAAVLPFSFFIAYGVMSIPAGFILEKFGEKRVMIAAFLASTIGSLTFAVHSTYSVAIISLFTIGAGMAVLQVVINPLLRIAGGEEHFAFNEAFAQLIFGSASFLSPWVYSYLVLNLNNQFSTGNLLLSLLARVTPRALPWVSVYWIFAIVTILMTVILGLSRFPKVERNSTERVGSVQMYRTLFRKPLVWLFFVSVFAYVGSEQGTADWISKFLSDYHGLDPHTTGAAAVSWFWGFLTTGCFIGMLLLKVFDSRKVIIGFSVAALFCLTVALFGNARASLIAFALMGLCASVMWPIMVSLALNSVPEYHGAFTGILSTGIMGGAVVPLIIGRIGDHFGLRTGVAVLFLTFGCVFTVGFWAKPIITNSKLNLKKNTVTEVIS